MEELRAGMLKFGLAMFIAMVTLPLVGCGDDSGPATVPENAQPLPTPTDDNASETDGKVNLPTE